MLRSVVVALLLWAAGGIAAAQEIPPVSGRPLIWIDPALGRLQPIELHDVAIDVRVHGFVASTRVDLSFFNPNDRVLEGELVFPLANGQSITGYALEVNGVLREGVVVDKQTARVAFEEIVRRGVDPGLAELTRGNVFRTRLYPIPAQGSKRVAFSFDQPLIDTGSAYRYVLPLQLAPVVKRFRVHAEAVRAESAPVAGEKDSPLRFERWREGFAADLERTDFRPARELVFEVPKPAVPVTAFAVADALEPAWRTFVAQVDSAPSRKVAAPRAPRRIALFYDASASAATRDRMRELAFLDAWLRTLGDVELQLVAFRNDADEPRTFALRAGLSSELREAILALSLDGGSSYGAIDLRAVQAPDVVLVFGDGLSNFGAHVPRLDGVQRLALVHAAQTFDGERLSATARRHGGTLLNLLELDTAQALAQLDAPRWMLRKTRVVAGECAELAPAAPQPVGPTFSLHGRCRGPAEIELSFGDGGDRSMTRRVRLDDAHVLDIAHGGAVTRLWAVARIAQLEQEPVRDERAIVALAKRHGVVTKNTSMLVLELIEDYVRYEVEPREPDLLAQYQAMRASMPKAQQGEDAQRQALLARVRAQWHEFREWHAQRHAWLETVLAPAAQLELARWRSVGTQQPEAAKLAREAETLAAAAQALQSRWIAEGADDVARVAWEREAATLMRRLHALRDRRLAIAPGSDDAAVVANARAGGGTPEDRQRSLARRPPGERDMVFEEPTVMAEAAPPPPASAPAPAADGEQLETITVVGSNIERTHVETSQPVFVVEREQLRKTSAGGKDEAQISGPVPQTSARVELEAWTPDTPYLAKIRVAADPYAAYLREREQYATMPAFFLDCADFFRDKDARIALRVLSNLAEIDFESAPLLRVLAYRLQAWDRFDLAVPLFEEVLTLRGEEPQSRRDLALALSRQPQADWVRAVELLWEVVTREWDGRFPDVQLIALHELNDVLARAPAGARGPLAATTARLGIERELLEPVVVDLRVVLSWDADNTDVDLWVIDPAGDTAIYSQPRTRTGGHMSRDFTGGYGPEVFTIRRALPGTYTVKAHYFGDRQQKLTGAVTVQAEFQTAFAAGDSKREAVTRRLEGDEDVIEIGRFTVGLD